MSSTALPPELEKLVPKTTPVDFSKPLDSSNLNDRSVLITGGASGIGLACAEAFASHGSFVTIADLQQEAGTAAATDLTSKGYKVQFIFCDVTSYNSQCSAFKSAITFGNGKLDIVAPVAGVLGQKHIVKLAAETKPSLDAPPPEPGFNHIMDVNLKGAFYTSYLALHYFRLPDPANTPPFKKSIVLVSSVAGYHGAASSTTYTISKFGVRGILYGIREQALAAGVRVNLIAPWYVKTPMTTKATSGSAEIDANISVFGVAPMEDVTDIVMRFGADESVAGRAVIIMPEGNFDLGDYFWEGYGGLELQKALARTAQRVFKAQQEKAQQV